MLIHHKTIEVPGRISSSGEIIRAFDKAVLLARLAPLKEDVPESICVSLINSFANFEHEEAVKALLEVEFPGVPISLSSEILPEVMEVGEKYALGSQSLILSCSTNAR